MQKKLAAFQGTTKYIETNQELLLNHGLWIVYSRSQQMCYPEYFSRHCNAEQNIQEISKSLSDLFQNSGFFTATVECSQSNREEEALKKLALNLQQPLGRNFLRILQYIQLQKHSHLTDYYEFKLIFDEGLIINQNSEQCCIEISSELSKRLKGKIKESKLIKIIFEILQQNWKAIAHYQLMHIDDYIAFQNIYLSIHQIEANHLNIDQKEIRLMILQCYQSLQPFLPQLFDRKKEIALSSKKQVILTEIIKILLYQLNLKQIIFPDLLNFIGFKTNYIDQSLQLREIIIIPDISVIKQILNSQQMKGLSYILLMPAELFDDKQMKQYEQFYLEYVQFQFLFIQDIQLDDLLQQQILLIRTYWEEYKQQIVNVFKKLIKKKLLEQFVPIENECSLINSKIKKQYEKNHITYMRIVNLLNELKQLVKEDQNPQTITYAEYNKEGSEQLKQCLLTMISNVSAKALEILFKAFINEMNSRGTPYIKLFTLLSFQKWNQKIKVRCFKSKVPDFVCSKLFADFLNKIFNLNQELPISILEMKNILESCKLSQMLNWPFQILTQMKLILKNKENLNVLLVRLNKNLSFLKFVKDYQNCQCEDLFKMELKKSVNELIEYIQTIS